MASNKKVMNDEIVMAATGSQINKLSFIDDYTENSAAAEPSNSTTKCNMKRRLIEDDSSSSSFAPPTKKINNEGEKEELFKSVFDKVEEHEKKKLVGLTGLRIHYVNLFSYKLCEKVDPTNKKSNIRLIKTLTQQTLDHIKINSNKSGQTSPSSSQPQQNKRKGDDNQNDQPINKKPRFMHTNKTSQPLLQASRKCASSPVVTYAKPLNINNKDAKPILIAETQSLLKENKPNRTSSSYTGTEILLPKEDEETAKALVTLLFHIQMRFL